MNKTCKSCGTVFDLDEKILSDNVHWLKCSVCNEKWSVLDKNYDQLKNNNKIIPEENIENASLASFIFMTSPGSEFWKQILNFIIFSLIVSISFTHW